MRIKKIHTIFMLFTLMLSSSIIAFAGSGTTDMKCFTVSGIEYGIWSSIYTTPSTAMARTCNMSYSGKVPQGYAGAQARLYNSSGTLIKDTGMSWNKSEANGYQADTPYMSVATGYYYSYGITQQYNGSGYNTNYAYLTPNIYTN
jgi:hypothetical protein